MGPQGDGAESPTDPGPGAWFTEIAHRQWDKAVQHVNTSGRPIQPWVNTIVFEARIGSSLVYVRAELVNLKTSQPRWARLTMTVGDSGGEKTIHSWSTSDWNYKSLNGARHCFLTRGCRWQLKLMGRSNLHFKKIHWEGTIVLWAQRKCTSNVKVVQLKSPAFLARITLF